MTSFLGTSDEHLSITQFLAEAGIDGAVIVTTPQEISLQVRTRFIKCKLFIFVNRAVIVTTPQEIIIQVRSRFIK